VVKAKVQGSINLHELVPNQNSELDSFIMLSSVVGIVGNAGQANYAGGCAFQDALARYRVARGLHGTSLSLRMIKSAGYLANNMHIVCIGTSLVSSPISPRLYIGKIEDYPVRSGILKQRIVLLVL
jgi:hypothetical protein